MFKIEIENDVFNIIKRLKKIDKNYFVLYVHEKRLFEIHHKKQQNTYCLTLPYKTLDKRTLDYVLKSRVENIKKIIKEMEENNQKLENKSIEEKIDQSKYELTCKLKYLQNEK